MANLAKLNKDSLKHSKKRAYALLDKSANIALIGLGRYLLQDAAEQAEYRNLTGNTITSIAIGIYFNKMLREMYFIDGKRPAIRVKLGKGETVTDFVDYDGNVRSYFTADVDSNRGWGQESSYRFLSGYTPKGRYSLVMTTGTEYSEYLEKELDLNVLTDTKNMAKAKSGGLLASKLKKI